MSKEEELLHLMISEKEEYFDAKQYAFYDFMDKLNMEKEEYENLLTDLCDKGYIKIIPNIKNKNNDIIVATKKWLDSIYSED